MKRLLSAALILSAVLCDVSPGAAQDRAALVVATNYPDAIVYIDTVRHGAASGRVFVTRAGTRTVRLVAAEEVSWNITPVEMEVSLNAGDTVHVSMDFPLYYHFETHPLGATTFLVSGDQRAALGRTPFTYRSKGIAEGNFVIERSGYRAESIQPGQEIWNRYVFHLQPLVDGAGPGPFTLAQAPKRRRWIDVTAATLVAAGGVLAVHYKFKADRIDDEYQATGDPSLRPRVAQLDDYAMAALIGMQAGVVTIGVRFFLRK